MMRHRCQVPKYGYLSVYDGKVLLVEDLPSSVLYIASTICHGEVKVKKDGILTAVIRDGMVWASQYEVVVDEFMGGLHVAVDIEDLI